jgi:valyl-tRNA synthetase
MLDKTYDAASVEPRIYDAWEKAGAFKAGAGAKEGAPTYTIVIPPPNVTGSLHMGHALNNTLQDILVRFERMRGKDVLWQPGTDHAGIATQMVVERQMMERQEPNRRAIGREKFLDKVWTWKAESGGLIINQLKRLGASCDWSRERFTMDEGLSKAVLKVFVDLYRQKLLYKDKRLVNWDPKLQTAISDLEVQQVEVKGHLWHIKYPIEGEPDRFITVATTRPETMLGDTGVAVHPDDVRYQTLIGKNAMLPLVGRKLKIVADAYSDPEKGSGAVKITPAHDFNDFEVGKRHGLPMINVLDIEAHLALDGNADFLAGLDETPELKKTIEELHGRDRIVVRKRLVEMLEEKGLVEKIEDHVHAVPHGDRSAVPIEPFLTDQWYVDAKTLAKPAIASVREGRTAIVPKSWEKTYYDWMENIQPWCVSRQLWWGHQIPAWYGPAKDGDNLVFGPWHIFVDHTEDLAVDAAKSFYGRDVRVVNSRAEATSEAAAEPGATQPGVPIWRDEDVLDTWFSSALWPFSTLGWPEETPELARYYPTNTLVTGFDIIFFWVARMMMMGIHFMKKEPFKDVYIHALVRDEKGAKMSKSKGNVIDPLSLIDEYGADALRFTLAAMAAQGRDIKLSTQRVEGYRNFATKLWNAARFAEHYECKRVPGFDPSSAKEILNRWIATETSRAATEITTAIEEFKFNEAAAVAYRFVWNLTCDWYLELAKPALNGEDGPLKEETRATVAWLLDRIVALLHPFMPFITEALWVNSGEGKLLALSPWPALSFEDKSSAEEINWLIDLIAAIRSVRAEINVPAAAIVNLSVSGAAFKTAQRLQHHEALIKRLARVDVINLARQPQKGAVQIVLGEATISMPVAGLIDLVAERTRLQKEIARLDSEIGKIDQKLGNSQFVAKAKEEVVEEQRERRAENEALRQKTEAALQRLSMTE